MSAPSGRDRVIENGIRRAVRRAGRPSDTACVTPETLASWADGDLSSYEAQLVEQHLAACSHCQEVAAVFERADVAPRTLAPPRRVWSTHWLVPAAFGTFGVAVLVFVVLSRTIGPVSQNARFEPVAPATRPSAQPPAATNPAPVELPRALAPAAPAQTTAPPRNAALAVPPPSEAAPIPEPPPAEVLAVSAPEAPSPKAAADRTVFVVSEFRAPAAASDAASEAPLAGRSGIAAGRGGPLPVASAIRAAPRRILWRIFSDGHVERSTDGATWEPVSVEPGARVAAGVAPSTTICWLVGRAGLVLLSTNGATFTRLSFPVAVDLAAVRAINGRDAVVTSIDGRSFATSDGGQTWH